MPGRSGRRAVLAATVAVTASLLLGAGGGGLATEAGAATAKVTVYEVGKSYFSENGYVEYIPGNAPVILTAPHGGALMPDAIPDRTKEACGGSASVMADRNTAQLTLAMRQSFYERYGTWPHVIINRLARRKFDANRPLDEAACGNEEVTRAFSSWHAFIDAAKTQVVQASGRGWHMDIHGHAHDIDRLELGYLLTSDELNTPDAALDANVEAKERSSVRMLLQKPGTSLSVLMRGPMSLGTLYAGVGFRSTPSAGDPGPGDERFFSGGYNTRRHGCSAVAAGLGGRTDGAICGVQIESQFNGVRDKPENWKRFGDATATILGPYLSASWGLKLSPASAPAR